MGRAIRIRAALLVSGLRWRAASSVVMFGVAVVGVAAGAFGLIYLHSADQAILDTTLAGAAPGALGLTLEPAQRPGSPGQLDAALHRVPRPARPATWFGTPIVTSEAGLTVTADGQPYLVGLVARSGSCTHLVIVAGSCASHNGAVVLSTRSAALLGVALHGSLSAEFTDSARTVRLTVAGLYAPTNAAQPYWWGSNYFPFGTGTSARPTLDDAFTTARTIQADAPANLVFNQMQVPFVGRPLPVDSVATLKGALARYQRTVAVNPGVLATTDIGRYLSHAATAEHVAGSVIVVVVLEMVLLVTVVLYFVASRTAAERGSDVRLALVKGFRTRSTVALSLAEPLAMVAAATPVGLLVAWVAGDACAAALFGAGVGASVTLLAVGAALGGWLAGTVAVVLANRRVVADSELDVAEQLSRRGRGVRTVVETTAVAVAGAAFVELAVVGVSATSPSSGADPLSALAPGLSALALGVLGARILPGALGAIGRATTTLRSVAWTLATRRVARQPEFTAQIVVLSMAAALAVFAMSGWWISARNRTVQDSYAVGASRVLTVSVRPGVDFLSAVRAADPAGHAAMAAVVERASDGTTLAVDAGRMNGVVSWPAGVGAGGLEAVARHLVPTGLAPPVELSGAAVELKVDSTGSVQPPPQLSLGLFDVAYQTAQQVPLGALVPGNATYAASLAGLCPLRCRLADIALTWNPSPLQSTGAASIGLDVTGLSQLVGTAWQPLPAHLDQAGRWANPTGGATLSSSSAGLDAAVVLDPSGASVDIAPDDVPTAIPAVVTSSVAGLNPGGARALSIVGLDGATVTARSVGVVPALPRVGATAVLVDLATAQRLLSGPFVDTTTEVWLSASAPKDIVSRLAEQGVTVVGVDDLHMRLRATAHGGVELAYRLFFIAGIVAGAMGVGATGFGVVVGARRRQGELAAMAWVGVPPRSLRRSLWAEEALATGAGLLLGTAAGLVAAAVALGSVPEFVSLGPGPPLEMGLPAGVVAAVVAGLVAALALAVWAGTRLVMGGIPTGGLEGVRS
jgi:putative ABC transport system permease protein